VTVPWRFSSSGVSVSLRVTPRGGRDDIDGIETLSDGRSVLKVRVRAVAEFLYRITEPLLAPIRNMLPNLGGLDISPIIVILIIMLIERVITYYIYPFVF